MEGAGESPFSLCLNLTEFDKWAAHTTRIVGMV